MSDLFVLRQRRAFEFPTSVVFLDRSPSPVNPSDLQSELASRDRPQTPFERFAGAVAMPFKQIKGKLPKLSSNASEREERPPTLSTSSGWRKWRKRKSSPQLVADESVQVAELMASPSHR